MNARATGNFWVWVQMGLEAGRYHLPWAPKHSLGAGGGTKGVLQHPSPSAVEERPLGWRGRTPKSRWEGSWVVFGSVEGRKGRPGCRRGDLRVLEGGPQVSIGAFEGWRGDPPLPH